MYIYIYISFLHHMPWQMQLISLEASLAEIAVDMDEAELWSGVSGAGLVSAPVSRPGLQRRWQCKRCKG